MTSISAAVLHAAKDLRLTPHTVPPPPADHLQISINTTTLCGSDLHYYASFRNGSIPCLVPLVLGHESAGTITALPPGPSAFSVGDRVAIECGIPCLQPTCHACPTRYNLCPRMKFRSSARGCVVSGDGEGDGGGTLQQRINHPARWCHKLPDSVGWTQGALLEPLSVAMHAVGRAGGVQGKRVRVYGAGPVGMLVAGVCGVEGALEVEVVDVNVGRLEMVKEMGWATATMVVGEGGGDAEFDVAFECSGVEASVAGSIGAVRAGGVVVLVGMGKAVMEVPVALAALREVDVRGSFRYANTYPKAVELVQSGKLKGLEKVVTHTFRGMGAVEQAFETALKGVGEDGKPVLKVECVFSED